MSSDFKFLSIPLLDEALEPFRKAAKVPRPPSGWARALREALGMTRGQLAHRIGVTAATVSDLERNEARATITLESLDRLAHGMDCQVVYAIVPKDGKTLDEIVHARAKSVALQQMGLIAHTMRLEEQGLSEAQQRRQVARIVDSLLSGTRRKLWN